MKGFPYFLVPLMALAALQMIVGCQSPKVVPPKSAPSVVTPAAAAIEGVKKKEEAVDNAETASRAAAAANVSNIITANSQSEPGPIRDTIADEASLAQQNLRAEPDPVELAAGEKRLRLRMEGKLELAEQSSRESRARADQLNGELAKAKDERDAAVKTAADAVAAAAKTIKENNAKHDVALQELQRKLDSKDLSYLTYICGGIGGLCLLGAIGIGVSSIYSPLGLNFKSICGAGTLVVAAIGCFGLVRFLNHPWIPYAVGGAILVAFIIAGVLWFLNWREQKHEDSAWLQEHEDTEKKLEAMTTTAAHLVDQIEIHAKQFPQATASLFEKLDGAMDSAEKQIVKSLKAIRPSKT